MVNLTNSIWDVRYNDHLYKRRRRKFTNCYNARKCKCGPLEIIGFDHQYKFLAMSTYYTYVYI